MEQHLSITMFGEFSISNENYTITDQMNRSKMIWSLLGYLIQNRDRAISCSDLYDLLWGNNPSKDPANTLKVLVHRVRNLLEALHPEEGVPFIIYYQDKYGWNPEIECSLDTDLFEEACKAAADESISEESKLDLLQKAIFLYKGEYMQKSSALPWVMQTSHYYSTKFLKASAEAAEILYKLKRYDELIDICSKALKYSPYDETFYILLLKALVESNQSQKAMDYYQQISETFFKEFGITPSDELKSIYKLIVKKNHSTEMNLEIIKQKLDEENSVGALYCEYEFFKTLYQLRARSAMRFGESNYIALLTVLNSSGTDLPNKKVTQNTMSSLKHTIIHSLRKSDVVTRFSINQFLVMLPNTTYETSNMVMKRIINCFRRDYPHAPVVLRHTTQPITVPEISK